jgi:hypothetical protein
MPAPQKTYEELENNQKLKVLNNSLDLLTFKPSLIGDVSTDKEFIERLIDFSKTLYEYFPDFARGSTLGSVRVTGT